MLWVASYTTVETLFSVLTTLTTSSSLSNERGILYCIVFEGSSSSSGGCSTFSDPLLTTILNDKNNSKDEAITEIYKMLRPGEPPTIEIATQIFNNLFFSSDRYDLSDVGRVKMNSRLDLECSDKITILRNEDIIAIIHKMLDLRDGKDDVDDIDHLATSVVVDMLFGATLSHPEENALGGIVNFKNAS